MLAFCLITLGILSRLVFHVDNFTPVIALALFGGVYLTRKQALLVPVVLFAVTDIILGFHQTMPFTWGAVLIIVTVGFWVRANKTFTTILGGGLMSALIFFIVTNFGVWLATGLYPLTAAGLVECFTMAVPFFRYTLVSTLLYGAIFFGAYEAVTAWTATRGAQRAL